MNNRRTLLLALGGAIVVAAIALFLTLQPKPQTAHRPVIAVATLMTHPSLDALQRGMTDELAEQGYIDGKTVEFVERNANGQIPLASTIASELASRNPDVIVPITTPMAQAVIKVARGPIVFASVTDPIGAGVVTTLDGEDRITGASDAWPYEAQLRLIREISPKAKRIGVLFNPGEAASQHGIKEIRRLATAMGFTVVEGAVNSTSDMNSVARSLTDRVDVFYLSSDNTVISGMAGALKVAIEKHIPYYVGDGGTVEKGGLAAVSVGYYEHGRHTGQLVARVLKGETKLPVIVENGTEVFVNTKAAELMGVKIPDAVLKRAAHIYTTIP